MRIQELERLVGIERATIRFYEKEGLIKPNRLENGYRDYSDADMEELKRIRLLRELGVSLETIRNLQKGTEDFGTVMRQQCTILQGRAQQMERARSVCERISADGTTYINMDTARYQNLLNAPLLPKPAWQGSGGSIFEEKDYREPHPWRRFFARLLDYQIGTVLLWCFLIFVLCFRTTSELVVILINFSVCFLMVPLEAAWLHFCGTTPGKWIFGIRVEDAVGGKLRFCDALTRAWKVLHAGMGFDIIGLNFYCFYKGYRAHKDDWYTDWDEDCEITFREEFSWVNVVMAVAVLLASIGLDHVSSRQLQLPRYQRDELTLAQFAENYNYLNNRIWGRTLQSMDQNGVIAKKGSTETMVIPGVGEVTYDPYAQFEYELDGAELRAITFHHTWYARDWFSGHDWFGDGEDHIDRFGWWAPSRCQAAILTAIASQEGLSVDEFNALHTAHVEDCGESCANGMTATYGDVTCTWDLDLEKYLDNDEEAEQGDVYEVTLDLRIEFQ